MSERPIIFSAPMVRAILDGRKTQTRRVVKLQPGEGGECWACHECDGFHSGDQQGASKKIVCPYGVPGDRLWVREAWAPYDEQAVRDRERDGIFYRADDETKYETDGRWRSPIYMPRWASRITLEITGVRVERVQEISAKDIRAEGAVIRAHDDQFGHNPVSAFDERVYLCLMDLWGSAWIKLHGRPSWDANPWVWAIEFRRVE